MSDSANARIMRASLIGSLHQMPMLDKKINEAYETGWNAALDHAAFRLENEFKDAFGKDTLSGIAIYLKGLKK
jgi:hypothetical protein